MALIAAHLTKVSAERVTHSAVAAHVAKESVRQTARRGRRFGLKATHGASTSGLSASKFSPRAPRVASARQSTAMQREPSASRSVGGRGGFGGHFGGFGGFGGGFGR